MKNFYRKNRDSRSRTNPQKTFTQSLPLAPSASQVKGEKLVEWNCTMLPCEGVAPALNRGASERTIVCHNLRKADGTDRLEPVGEPAQVCAGHFPGAALIPGGSFRLDDGSTALFAAHGDRLLCIEHGEAAYVDGFHGHVRAMVSIGDRMLMVTGEVDDAIELVRKDGKWRPVYLLGAPVPIMMLRRDEGMISSGPLNTTLTGIYNSRSTSLTQADSRKLKELFSEAYLSVCDRATAEGSFVQPVVARYRLIGRGGMVLYISAPVLLSPADGVQLTEATFSLSGSNYSQASCSGISARRFTIDIMQLEPLSEAWQQAVERIELLVSPQIHPLDEDGASHCIFGQFTANEGSVTVVIPGGGDRGSLVASRVARPMLVSLLARLDSALVNVGSARYQLDENGLPGWVGLQYPFYPDRTSTASMIKQLHKLLDTPLPLLTTEEKAMDAMSVPHRMRAEVTAPGGDLVGLGKISAIRFEGWLPEDFTVADRSGSSLGRCESACRVTFADGSTRVRNFTTYKGFSGLLSPLIAYPAPDAVSIELYQGGRYKWFGLTPDPSGRFSIYISNDLVADSIGNVINSSGVPEEEPRRVEFPSLTGVAAARLPLRPLALTESAHGDAVALCGMAGSAGGWDSGAGRFYIFGSGGTQSMTVSANRRRVSLRLLDPRPVVSRESVAEGSGVVVALAGGDAVKISGQKVTTLLRGLGEGALAIDGPRNELICCHNPDNPVRITYPQGSSVGELLPRATAILLDGSGIYTRSLPDLTSVIADSGKLYGMTPEGALVCVTDSADESSPQECVFAINKRVAEGGSGKAPGVMLMEIPVRGLLTNGEIEVFADNGGGPQMASLLTQLALSGYYPHLLPLRLLAPHCHGLTLTLRFSASPGKAYVGV